MRTKWQHVVELKGRRGCRIKEHTLINKIRNIQEANASLNKERILAKRTFREVKAIEVKKYVIVKIKFNRGF